MISSYTYSSLREKLWFQFYLNHADDLNPVTIFTFTLKKYMIRREKKCSREKAGQFYSKTFTLANINHFFYSFLVKLSK